MSTKRNEPSYIPALKYHWLTHLYDPIVALTTREHHVKTCLIEQAQISERSQVLDIGCGTGTLAIMVKRRFPSAGVYGIDADAQILGIANRKANTYGIKIHLDHGYSYALPYDDNRFDRVLSSLFFHHLTRTDKERTLREIYRVLKPGGQLHVADWGKPSSALARGLFLTVQLLDGFETTRDNIEGLLPQLMEAAGFNEVNRVGEVPTMYGTLAQYKALK